MVSVKQSFPTVQETMGLFGNIRDQQHHNTAMVLKRCIKRQKSLWQKHYVNQIVHEVMYSVLLRSYKEVGHYRESMFSQIADALNMQYTFCSEVNVDGNFNGDGDCKQSENGNDGMECWKTKSREIIGKRFGSYFKSNYRTILRTEAVADKVLESVLNGQCIECLKDIKLDQEAMDRLRKYANECCAICWIMTLQDPPLAMVPDEWRAAEGVKYDSKRFKKVIGSDRKSENVLYYVWPVVVRKQTVLADQKWEVVVRNKMYESCKECVGNVNPSNHVI